MGVVGASGYTGLELLTVLGRHPDVQVRFATSRSQEGRPTGIPGLSFSDPGGMEPGALDVVFLCVPHGEALEWVARLRDLPCRIVDLTADHRPGSGREMGWVFGLPELTPKEVEGAQRVANPGCYPTAAILALHPLLAGGLLNPARPIVVNAASGVTGAGRTPRLDLLFAEVSGNYRAYGVGNTHRHLREMRATLPGIDLLFVPHLLPVPRGILETIALPVRAGVKAADVRETWRAAYGGGPAVRVVEEGIPTLADVVGTDRLDLAVVDNEGLPDTLTVLAALDNLGKGAAGQAVQNMNLMLGLPVGSGLRC